MGDEQKKRWINFSRAAGAEEDDDPGFKKLSKKLGCVGPVLAGTIVFTGALLAWVASGSQSSDPVEPTNGSVVAVEDSVIGELTHAPLPPVTEQAPAAISLQVVPPHLSEHKYPRLDKLKEIKFAPQDSALFIGVGTETRVRGPIPAMTWLPMTVEFTAADGTVVAENVIEEQIGTGSDGTTFSVPTCRDLKCVSERQEMNFKAQNLRVTARSSEGKIVARGDLNWNSESEGWDLFEPEVSSP